MGRMMLPTTGRGPAGRRLQFATEKARLDHESALDVARRNQTSRYAVAPGQRVGSFGPGSPIDLETLPDSVLAEEHHAAERAMNRLVHEGVVIELSDEELHAAQTPATARFIVASGRSYVSVQRGIVPAGCEVTDSDFPSPARLHELVAAGHIIDRKKGHTKT